MQPDSRHTLPCVTSTIDSRCPTHSRLSSDDPRAASHTPTTRYRGPTPRNATRSSPTNPSHSHPPWHTRCAENSNLSSKTDPQTCLWRPWRTNLMPGFPFPRMPLRWHQEAAGRLVDYGVCSAHGALSYTKELQTGSCPETLRRELSGLGGRLRGLYSRCRRVQVARNCRP